MKRFAILLASLLFVVGMATSAMAAGANGNNFTMLDPTGAPVGGTNDVDFTWDGTLKTSVALSGQVSNATLSSPTTFFGLQWDAHDLALYGPGTYTVYAGALAGSPGDVGAGNPISFTVGAGQVGAHMLFDWPAGADNNIDVVNVWETAGSPTNSWDDVNSTPVNGPFWTGGGYGDANTGATVFQFVSSDMDPATPRVASGMVDGAFPGFSANFNVTAIPEPASLLLIGTGLVGLIGIARKRG